MRKKYHHFSKFPSSIISKVNNIRYRAQFTKSELIINDYETTTVFLPVSENALHAHYETFFGVKSIDHSKSLKFS